MLLYKEKDNLILAAQYKDPLIDHLSEKVLSYLKNGDGKKLLDIGCGAGRIAIMAAQRGFNVIGLDSEERVIEFAKKKTQELGVKSKCQFICKNIFQIKGTGFGKFDLVVCSEVIEHVKEPEKIIRIAFNLLKDGGLLILTTPHDSRQWTVLDDYGEHLKRFQIKEIVSLVKGHKILSVYTIGFPSFRGISWIYNLLIKRSRFKHDSSWRDCSFFNTLFYYFLRFTLRVDDLFNSLNLGTNIIVVVEKS